MQTKLLVKLPEDLKAFYHESGYNPTTALENRGNARLRVRRDAEIRFTFTPPSLRDDATFPSRKAGRALIKDISKTGVGILYHEQVFPEERFEIAFQGRLIHAVAVRCRHLASECYEIGARIQGLEPLTHG